jgi:hypothetical protein
MRNAGRLVMGFYPLPEREAKCLQCSLRFPATAFSALDPCVGDGAAFHALLEGASCHRYGIELDTVRASQARSRSIDVIHGDALEVSCAPESLSLLYLNPPYDFEVGAFANRRFEELFPRYTCRWLKRGGVLVFVIPQRQLSTCSSFLAEYFASIRVYRLTSPECVQYHQVAVLAARRTTKQSQNDRQYQALIAHLTALGNGQAEIPDLTDTPDATYTVPASGPAVLTNRGLPMDMLEDLLPKSSAYHQASRVLLRQPTALSGRPITQLHGGHVALLAASGALNGVFGQGADRHMANWSPSKMFHHSVQLEEDGAVVHRTWSSYSPKLLLLYEDGRTKVLTHRKTKPETEDDGQHDLAEVKMASSQSSAPKGPAAAPNASTSKAARRTVRRHISLPKS